jgi:hypothetical protein
VALKELEPLPDGRRPRNPTHPLRTFADALRSLPDLIQASDDEEALFLRGAQSVIAELLQAYDPTKTVKLYCLCLSPFAEDTFVRCSFCQHWYHPDCCQRSYDIASAQNTLWFHNNTCERAYHKSKGQTELSRAERLRARQARRDQEAEEEEEASDSDEGSDSFLSSSDSPDSEDSRSDDEGSEREGVPVSAGRPTAEGVPESMVKRGVSGGIQLLGLADVALNSKSSTLQFRAWLADNLNLTADDQVLAFCDGGAFQLCLYSLWENWKAADTGDPSGQARDLANSLILIPGLWHIAWKVSQSAQTAGLRTCSLPA